MSYDRHHRLLTELSHNLRESPCPLAVPPHALVTSDLHLLVLFVFTSTRD